MWANYCYGTAKVSLHGGVMLCTFDFPNAGTLSPFVLYRRVSGSAFFYPLLLVHLFLHSELLFPVIHPSWGASHLQAVLNSYTIHKCLLSHSCLTLPSIGSFCKQLRSHQEAIRITS